MKRAMFHPSTGSRRQRGVAAVEFALIFLLFFTIVYGAATFGTALYTQQVLSRAAEDGARAISLMGVTALTTNDPHIQGVVHNSLAGSLIAPLANSATTATRKAWIQNTDNVVVQVDPSCAGVAGCVKVTVRYQYSRNRILPVLPLLNPIPDTLVASAIAPK